ncbi:MAG: hypothetical protein R2734_13515 [Nocardioides sp.]
MNNEEEKIERFPRDDEPFLGAGLQDRLRPAPGQADLRACLLESSRPGPPC